MNRPEDDVNGVPLVAVLSYGLWQRAFGGNRAVVGQNFQLSGRTATVAGVMPPGFRFPAGELDPAELSTPLQLDPAKPGGRDSHYLYLLGRLKPGIGIQQARDEFDQLVRQWGNAAAPRTHAFNPKGHPIVSYPLHSEVVGQIRPAMLTLLGAVGFLLLIACVHVANLLLARAEARQREIAIRRAMGAAVPRLVRQFITEGMLLALAGVAVGLALAFAGLRIIVAAGQQSILRAGEIVLNWQVLAFTLITSVATGLFFGLAPLVQLLSSNPHDALKSATGRTTTTSGVQLFRQGMVVWEITSAVVLLIGTGLMIRAFWKLQEVDPGFRADNVLTMRVALPPATYSNDQSLLHFWPAALEALDYRSAGRPA